MRRPTPLCGAVPVCEAIMIHVVENWNARQHAVHVEQMFALRARVFGGRLGGGVVRIGDRGRDAFDGACPVYVLATDARDTVVGSCRLLPTTGPTLIEARFSDAIPDAARLVDPAIWECTLFCTAPELRNGHPDAFADVTRELLHAVADLASRAGISTIVAELDAATMRLCRGAGHRVDLLGTARRGGSAVYLGALLMDGGAGIGGERDGVVRGRSETVDEPRAPIAA